MKKKYSTRYIHEFNPVLRIASWFGGLGGYFLRKHLSKEGKSFARDIEQKFTSN